MTAACDELHQKAFTRPLIVGIGAFMFAFSLYILVFGLLFKNSTFALILTSTLCALVFASIAAGVRYISYFPSQPKI